MAERDEMHKGFDHDKFAADCDANNMDQLISYNSDQLRQGSLYVMECW
jgi:hypothetical protein